MPAQALWGAVKVSWTQREKNVPRKRLPLHFCLVSSATKELCDRDQALLESGPSFPVCKSVGKKLGSRL